jgi:hypothetical protein
LIGFASLGPLAGREHFKKGCDETKTGYDAIKREDQKIRDERGGDPPKSELDCNHSHFVLVQNPRHKSNKEQDNGFNAEFQVRSAFERIISRVESQASGETRKIPIVTVSIQGGPGTVSTVLHSVRCYLAIVRAGERARVAHALCRLRRNPMQGGGRWWL